MKSFTKHSVICVRSLMKLKREEYCMGVADTQQLFETSTRSTFRNLMIVNRLANKNKQFSPSEKKRIFESSTFSSRLCFSVEKKKEKNQKRFQTSAIDDKNKVNFKIYVWLIAF